MVTQSKRPKVRTLLLVVILAFIITGILELISAWVLGWAIRYYYGV